MNRKSLSLVICCFLAILSRAWGDGFIIVTQPTVVPPGHFPFAPLEVSHHHVEAKIQGQVATTSVDQEFYNPNDQRLEGTYLFPVPKGAHIEKFSMDIGGKMVDAELLPADKARSLYEEIVRKMRDPALLEYAGRDVFKVRIFPIEPRSRKQVKLSYTELLHSDSGALSYNYPLNTEKFSAKPIKSLSIKVELKTDQPLASIYSPSHKVEIKRDGSDRAIVGYEASNEKPDTDFQLVFTQDTRELGVNLLSYKTGSEDGYFILLATPSVSSKEPKPAPKDVAFVIDSSGSMAGAKLSQAKKALGFCIENLNAEDRFEIVRFSTEAEPLFGKLKVANAENRKKATDFVESIKPIGGTAIAEALKVALKSRESNEASSNGNQSAPPFVAIFLTDGLPTVGETSEEGILSKLSSKSASNVRVFTFGIGSDVNTHLLDRLAESTRAFSQYVLDKEDIEVKVSNFFTRIKEPALTNLRLEISGGVHVSKIYPAELPDLFRGDQLVLTGRYSGSGPVEVRLSGKAAGQDQSFSYKTSFTDNSAEREFIPRLWATRRVGFLLDEIRLHGENSELRDEVTALARQFGIVTPYTAYLILEDEKRRDVPTALQSIPQLDKDKAVFEGASKAFLGLKTERSGGSAVAAARAQNIFKNAEQAADAISSNNRELFSGAVVASPATRAENERFQQYAQQNRFVNGRTFYQNGNQWIDANVQNLRKRQSLKFNSPEYFTFLNHHPEAAQWMALGSNVQFALADTIYEISE